MKVEIWSDVVCPWCYIGKRRFETALGAFDGRDEVEVQWRSFQLNPDQPRGVRTTHDEYLATKLRTSVDQVHEMNARVVGLAAAEGLHYDFDRYQVINTFDAHRVAHLGKAHGLDDQVQERFLSAQLEQGEVLDDVETLVRLGEELGIPGRRDPRGPGGRRVHRGGPGRHRRGPCARDQRRAVLRDRPPVRDLRRPAGRAVPPGADPGRSTRLVRRRRSSRPPR